jgi:3-deoxy-manno-octulosonate cytidylyltransferase (CMP-KDO synthetase)
MEQTPLEIIESVDMMRLLENGIPVKMVPTQVKTKAVDTLEDLLLVEKLMQDDKLMSSYS